MDTIPTIPRAIPGPGLLTIGTLSRETGIPVPTLRTWERRYGQPVPLRRASGHRLYPADCVSRLRQVTFLLQHGHRAANLLVLQDQQLDALAVLSRSRERSGSESLASTAGPEERGHAVLMRAVRRLDGGTLLGELRLEWARSGPMRFLTEVAGPLMVEVGVAWQTQALEVRHEHFAAACVGGLLRELRQPYDHAAAGPRVVAAALPADQHEGGLLMASLVLALRGRRVIYLGADTPLTETARAAEGPRTEAVAVSVSAAFDRDTARARLTELRTQMPPHVALWVGGAGAPDGVPGVERLADLYALDARLGALR